MENLPQPGTIVRLMRYNGIVQHVYLREDGQDAWLEITFVNNLFKQQPHELHLWSKVKDVLQAADSSALEAEFEMSRETLERRFSQLAEITVNIAYRVNGKVVARGSVQSVGESHEPSAPAQ